MDAISSMVSSIVFRGEEAAKSENDLKNVQFQGGQDTDASGDAVEMDPNLEEPLSSHSLRGSGNAVALYGPIVSSRVGRPDHLASIIKQVQNETLDALDHEMNDEEREHALKIIEDKKRALEQLKELEETKLVQVNLKEFAYHVPIEAEGHSKQTIFNQSICYFTYEFFDRVVRFAKKPKRTAQDVPRQWTPRTVSDLFLPFEKRTVLQNLNLVFEPGKSYVVLGPPASGKTTLLQAISGRLKDYRSPFRQKVQSNKPHMTGRIEFNGVSKDDDPSMVLANIVSYVQQLDVHAPYLTVKETFEFAKQSRTGGKDSSLDDQENLTIEGLGLAHVKDTFVGNSDVRGVSGGQRRRVTLGEMMEGFNPVACADEISTGLDAAATYDICKSIVDFARRVGTTRIVSLLQPGPETFALFDEVVLLSEGYVVYAGPVGEVVAYFETLGYKLPTTVDVADFLQVVATPEGVLLFDSSLSPRNSHYTAEQFAEAFEASKYGRKIQEKLDSGSMRSSWRDAEKEDESGRSWGITTTYSSKVPDDYKQQYQNSWVRSFGLNFHRFLTLWVRDWGYIVGKAGENVGMAVATGGILFGKASVDDGFPGELGSGEIEAFDSVQNGVYSALFMTCLHMTLGTSTSTPDDIDERPIHYKHGDANFYQTTAYVMGRLCSTLPQRAIEIVSFGIPLYFMVDLDTSPDSFFIYLAILLSYTFAIKMMFGILAQVLPNKNNVLSFGTFLVLLFSLFSGFIIYPSQIPFYYDWLYYVNPFAWAFQALLINEFTSSKYTDGELLLLDRGFKTDRKWIMWSFVFLIPYTLLSALLLSLVLKYVRIQPKMLSPKKHAVDEDALGEDLEESVKKSRMSLPFVPVDLSFEDVVYEVKASTSGEMLRLLNGVSGLLQQGRMCALMGSSGAGKTTLMDVIALRKTSGTITGDVRLNGFPQERISFLRSSGYVEQFDIQQPELTVAETVRFSARLRLDPNNAATSTDEGKQKFVEKVLEMMELTNISNEQVGSFEEGGLTFEQRKRLAIAVELAASPSVIFLDEPTSGLDSRGALVVMRAMKKIALTGRTICATIHQPSSAVFEMFDDLLLLKKGGEVVFFGELGSESKNLVDYFESNGCAKPIEHGENPAAWMLRQYTGSDDVNWKEVFEESAHYRELKDRITEINESQDEAKKISYDSEFATSLKRQIYLMNNRVLSIMKRAPSYNLARLMLAIIYGFLIGSVSLRFQRSNNEFPQEQVDGILSSMFLALTIMGVVSISMAVPVMKQMRDVFYKHRASGMLDHNSIAMAVTVGELPYIFLISVLFASVYYVTVGLFASAERWWLFWLYFTFNNAIYTYFGQAFICLVKDIPTAGALVGALIGYNVFFSGLVVRPQYFSGPFQLGYWTCPGRFAYQGMVMSQFYGLDSATVVASPGSAWWYEQDCNILEPCVTQMEDYVRFFFGGRFDESQQPVVIAVLFFCLFLARLLLWFSLTKFNYVNT